MGGSPPSFGFFRITASDAYASVLPTQAVGMNQLPFNLLVLIASKTSLEDVKNLRLVSKSLWRLLAVKDVSKADCSALEPDAVAVMVKGLTDDNFERFQHMFPPKLVWGLRLSSSLRPVLETAVYRSTLRSLIVRLSPDADYNTLRGFLDSAQFCQRVPFIKFDRLKHLDVENLIFCGDINLPFLETFILRNINEFYKGDAALPRFRLPRLRTLSLYDLSKRLFTEAEAVMPSVRSLILEQAPLGAFLNNVPNIETLQMEVAWGANVGDDLSAAAELKALTLIGPIPVSSRRYEFTFGAKLRTLRADLSVVDYIPKDNHVTHFTLTGMDPGTQYYVDAPGKQRPPCPIQKMASLSSLTFLDMAEKGVWSLDLQAIGSLMPCLETLHARVNGALHLQHLPLSLRLFTVIAEKFEAGNARSNLFKTQASVSLQLCGYGEIDAAFQDMAALLANGRGAVPARRGFVYMLKRTDCKFEQQVSF